MLVKSLRFNPGPTRSLVKMQKTTYASYAIQCCRHQTGSCRFFLWWTSVKFSNVWIFVCCLGVVLPASYFAQHNPPSQGREVTQLYANHCVGCHGADLSGGSASSLVNGTWRYGGDDAS